ncbi:hypothetical protein NY2A_b599R [Paramecium bursaria Chlorella virus NY2A]|uniref:Uncharacterized protein b599R n=1 Tax=Paramecium bursaria Chlorella virus NY2A TaxID=46021 RepID=A7IXC4_PBCVN|nr:hypothetical protein NY2A_b599R [Paramecium bursaria Chlorella virus NY2A]ABT14998.1 hypothetical protein NY2A_b599R [Paramecium bursaria Chlorella virus NY2A]
MKPLYDLSLSRLLRIPLYAVMNFKSSTFFSMYLAASLKLLNSSMTLSSLYAMHGCREIFAPSYLPLS